MTPWRGLLAAACVLVPLWAWLPTGVSDARLDGGLLALLVLALAAACLRRAVPRLPGTVAFLAALLLGGLALLMAEGHLAWGGLADRAPLLAGWLLCCLAAAPAVGAGAAFPVVLAGVAAAAAYGLLQILGLDFLGWRSEPHAAPVAPFAHSNAAAEVLAPALVAAVAWLGAGATPRRRLWLIALAPMAFQLGWLGVAAARLSLPLGLGWAAWRARGAEGAARRGAWSSALLVLALFAAGEGGRAALAPRVDEAGAAIPAPESFSTAKVRWLMATASLERALAAPLGIGLGRFEADYPFFRPEEELRLSSQDYTDVAVPRPATPHNEPLLAVLELGWLGGALALAAVVLLLRRPGRAAWTTPALLAVGVHALLRSPLSHDPAALALAALLAGMTRIPPKGDDAPATKRLHPILLLGLALLPAVAAPFQLGGEWALSRYFRSAEDGARLAAAARAAAWRPWDAVAANLLAAELSRAGDDPAPVRDALGRALEHDPGNLRALTGLVKLEMLRGNERDALGWLVRAEEVAAAHPAVVEARVLWIREQAKRQRRVALALLEAADPQYELRLAAGNLLDAAAAARAGDLEEARRELLVAASEVPRERALIERSARQEPLDPALVRKLCARVLEDILPSQGAADSWEQILGP